MLLWGVHASTWWGWFVREEQFTALVTSECFRTLVVEKPWLWKLWWLWTLSFYCIKFWHFSTSTGPFQVSSPSPPLLRNTGSLNFGPFLKGSLGAPPKTMIVSAGCCGCCLMFHSDSPAVGFGCPADQINSVFILPALLTGMGVLLSLSCRERAKLFRLWTQMDLPGKEGDI